MITSSQATSVRTTCSRCGTRLGSDDVFCVGCGARISEMSGAGASNPSGAQSPNPLLTRAELRHTVLGVEAASKVLTCTNCKASIAPDELFCPGCGRSRDGGEVFSMTGLESKAEAAWREVQDRLESATSGRYQIVRELGRGGMAAVYLAKEIALNRDVAIKVMRPSFLLDPGMVERFLREARTMASLRHPNIVSIYSVEEANQLYFFVMQFVPGRSLDRVIGGEQLPVAAMQAVMYEAAAALTHAHRQGVVHRDIKPANIMLDSDGSAMVTDFGIAKVADVQATSATVGMMGTPLYMSPEQCEGRPVTPMSDQYSLGNVAYEMLAGVPPFQRDSAIALGSAILNEKPKPIRTFRNDCPPDIEAAVLRMLEKTPTDRFPTLTEAAAALGGDRLADDDPLREFLRALAQRDARSDGTTLTPRPSRTGRRWVGPNRWRLQRLVAAVIVIAAAAPLGYLGFRRFFSKGTATATPGVVPAVQPGSPESRVAPGQRSVGVVPGPAVPPAPPAVNGGASRSAGDAAAQVSALVVSIRSAINRREWQSARDGLARAIRLAPKSAELRAIETEIDNGAAADSRLAVNTPSPGPASVPANRTTAAAEAVTLPKKAFDDAPVVHAIEVYLAAVNSRSFDQIRAVYPGMTSQQEKDWRENRFDKDIKKISAVGTRPQVEETSGGARAVFTVDLNLDDKKAGSFTTKLRCEATLRLEGGEWKIISLTERGIPGQGS